MIMYLDYLKDRSLENHILLNVNNPIKKLYKITVLLSIYPCLYRERKIYCILLYNIIILYVYRDTMNIISDPSINIEYPYISNP